MVSIRELLGTIGLAGLLYLPLNSQETPKNFKPVGIVESKEEDKNNNGVQDSKEKVIDYNNSTYKYFRVYHNETKKQTYFIADKDYKLIKDRELYYHLFSVITINESAKNAKKQNFEKHLSEWASDYEKIRLGILTTDIAKKSMEGLSKLEGLLINEHFFGGRKIPEALDYVLVEGSDLIAKKRANDGFNEIIKELAEGLSVENPKDIADYVLNNMQKITVEKITAARKRLLIAKKRLDIYDPNKDFWSLTQAEEFVNDLVGGLEGITYAKAYLASLGKGGSLEIGAKLIAENFAEGLTGASIDKIVFNLTKNEHLQKIKGTIEESRTRLAKSLGNFYTALDPKQDPTLEVLLLDEKIINKNNITGPRELRNYDTIGKFVYWNIIGAEKEPEEKHIEYINAFVSSKQKDITAILKIDELSLKRKTSYITSLLLAGEREDYYINFGSIIHNTDVYEGLIIFSLKENDYDIRKEIKKISSIDFKSIDGDLTKSQVTLYFKNEESLRLKGNSDGEIVFSVTRFNKWETPDTYRGGQLKSLILTPR